MRHTPLILFLIGSVLGAWFLFTLRPVGSDPGYVSIEIASGSGFGDIARLLYEEGVIRSKAAFSLYSVFSGSAHRLKPGQYLVSAGSSTPAILRAFVRGPQRDVEVRIPEGATIKDIDAILSEKGIVLSGSLTNASVAQFVLEYPFVGGVESLEGFLFPDTYRFFVGSTAAQVIEKFLHNFEKKAISIISDYSLPAGGPITNEISNIQELITAASILEKEIPEYEDRRVVAGILYKRLKVGMALQVDATIVYAKCGGAFVTCDDPKMYRSDTGLRSPYNTYLFRGLPPGPIGNPGADAIRAAMNPVQSEYWYYLSDPKTKQTIFSKTLDEHNENRARYLGA